jgi:hypothetical protein
LIGYRVLGAYGDLGTVVETEAAEGGADEVQLVIRGGSRRRLLFHLPVGLVRQILPDRRIMVSEVDVTDFTARLNDDGSVALYLTE